MENIHSDEDIREAKKMARLAATLGRSSRTSRSSRRKSKHRREGRRNDDEEEALFSGGDNDSDISDLENGVAIDSDNRRSSKSKSKSRRRSEDVSSTDMMLPDSIDRSESGVSLNELTHSRRKPDMVLHSEDNGRGERRDNRLNLSQDSASARSGVVSRESLQALVAAEDRALGNGSPRV
jgi:hypothetical protein